MALYSGQGHAFHADRDASGNPSNYAWFGNAPLFTLNLAVETLTHKESYTGNRTTDARIITENNANVSITVDDVKEANLVLALYGAAAAVTGSTVTGEAVLSTIPVVGEAYALKATGRVSAVTVKGNAVTISSSLYTVDASGVLKFSSIAGIAAPITADYTQAASRQVGAFKTGAPEKQIRLDGLNTARSISGDFAREVVEIFKVRLDPAENLGFINDEFNSLVINGSALVDDTKAQSSATGQFMRYIQFDN